MLLTSILAIVGLAVVIFFVRGLRESLRRKKQGVTFEARLLVAPFLEPPRTRYAIVDSSAMLHAANDDAPYFNVGGNSMFLAIRNAGGERHLAAGESSVLWLPAEAGKVTYDDAFRLTANRAIILNGATMREGVPSELKRGDWVNLGDGCIGEFY